MTDTRQDGGSRRYGLPPVGGKDGGREVMVPIDEETLRAMLSRENELRLSAETQELYRAVEAGENDLYESWMEVTESLQERVVAEFFPPAKDAPPPGAAASGSSGDEGASLQERRHDALFQMRSAALRHPDLALYVRHNRSRRGDIAAGDQAPNVPLQHVFPPLPPPSSSSSSSSSSPPPAGPPAPAPPPPPPIGTPSLFDFVPPHPAPLVVVGLSYS